MLLTTLRPVLLERRNMFHVEVPVPALLPRLRPPFGSLRSQHGGPEESLPSHTPSWALGGSSGANDESHVLAGGGVALPSGPPRPGGPGPAAPRPLEPHSFRSSLLPQSPEPRAFPLSREGHNRFPDRRRRSCSKPFGYSRSRCFPEWIKMVIASLLREASWMFLICDSTRAAFGPNT